MWNFMLRTEATISSDAAMEPSTIVCGDGNVETTVGFILLLYPWLRKVVEEPESCCGRNPFSILVILLLVSTLVLVLVVRSLTLFRLLLSF